MSVVVETLPVMSLLDLSAEDANALDQRGKALVIFLQLKWALFFAPSHELIAVLKED